MIKADICHTDIRFLMDGDVGEVYYLTAWGKFLLNLFLSLDK